MGLEHLVRKLRRHRRWPLPYCLHMQPGMIAHAACLDQDTAAIPRTEGGVNPDADLMWCDGRECHAWIPLLTLLDGEGTAALPTLKPQTLSLPPQG